MRLSRKGAKFIASFEGFRPCPYQDPVKVWTIGYGHTAGVTSQTRCISERKGRKLLRKDAAPVVRALYLANPHRRWQQHQVDALVSAGYNLGPGVFDRGRSLGDAIRHGSRKAVGDSLLLYDNAGGGPLPGLTRRRRAERRVFLHGYRR